MNVGVALGMCGYEIVRQWTGGGAAADADGPAAASARPRSGGKM